MRPKLVYTHLIFSASLRRHHLPICHSTVSSSEKSRTQEQEEEPAWYPPKWTEASPFSAVLFERNTIWDIPTNRILPFPGVWATDLVFVVWVAMERVEEHVSDFVTCDDGLLPFVVLFGQSRIWDIPANRILLFLLLLEMGLVVSDVVEGVVVGGNVLRLGVVACGAT